MGDSCLVSWELVHHRNTIKDDNRFENLELLSGRKYHLNDQILKGMLKRFQITIEKQQKEIIKLRQYIVELQNVPSKLS